MLSRCAVCSTVARRVGDKVRRGGRWDEKEFYDQLPLLSHQPSRLEGGDSEWVGVCLRRLEFSHNATETSIFSGWVTATELVFPIDTGNIRLGQRGA